MSNFNDKPTINSMKRNLTLDFNQGKKNSLGIPISTGVLSSPDVNMLSTPELEKIIEASGMSSTNTPTPSSILFPRSVTEEQESFATGFVDALNNLHNSNGNSNTSSSDNTSGGTVFMDLEQPSLQYMPVVKEEPQTVPNLSNTPPMSPVDMEAQERIKLERKRQRNRLAASKCRTRKLERISRLEDKVKHLKNENTDLASLVNQLKEHVGLLKVEVLDHVHAGCQISWIN